jgi:hypothetical protein
MVRMRGMKIGRTNKRNEKGTRENWGRRKSTGSKRVRNEDK